MFKSTLLELGGGFIRYKKPAVHYYISSRFRMAPLNRPDCCTPILYWLVAQKLKSDRGLLQLHGVGEKS